MAAVTEPGGTAGLSHLEGIDFAGKTGSAQTMSNALAAKLGHSHTVNDNAWFVGVSPRRNPDIAVVVLWEGGKEGYFSARLAARVIAAYVDKQRQKDHNLIAQQPQKIEVGALWSNPAAPDALGGKPLPARPGQKTDPELASIRGGHFTVPVQPQTITAKARITTSTSPAKSCGLASAAGSHPFSRNVRLVIGPIDTARIDTGRATADSRSRFRKFVTVDELVNVAASGRRPPGLKSVRIAVTDSDGIMVRYASTTSTCAPRARSASGITSRATAARASSTRFPSTCSPSASTNDSATYSSGVTATVRPKSSSARAVADPTAAIIRCPKSADPTPSNSRRPASAATPFALVTISHWYCDKFRSASSSSAYDSGGTISIAGISTTSAPSALSFSDNCPAWCRARVTRMVRPVQWKQAHAAPDRRRPRTLRRAHAQQPLRALPQQFLRDLPPQRLCLDAGLPIDHHAQHL